MASTINAKEVIEAISSTMNGIADEMRADEHFSKNPDKIEFAELETKYSLHIVNFCLNPEIQPKTLESYLEFTKKWMEAEEQAGN